MPSKNIVFKENQRFTQWWLWGFFLIPLGIIPLFAIYSQFILGLAFGDNPMSDWGLVVFILMVYGFIYFFYRIKLTTQITHDTILIHLFPFSKKEIARQDITRVEFVTYNPILVGGYGWKFTHKYGQVYNIKGNKGVLFILKNGKKIMVGTQKQDELKKLLQ